MILRVVQLTVAGLVIWAAIEIVGMENRNVAAIWGLCAAYALTVFPLQIWDWLKGKEARLGERARRESLGLPYGWKRHLPWNARKTEASLRSGIDTTGFSGQQSPRPRLKRTLRDGL
jgi:hypothetical protein